MTSASQYWNGTEKVELTAADVEAPKIKDHIKFKYARGVMNNAFQIFYDARQMISNVSDMPAKRAMTADLDDVGQTGWGLGVDDLKEAFEHLATNGGKWKDNSTSEMGWYTSDQIVCGITGEAEVGYVKIPISLENFLDALNAKFATMRVQLTSMHMHGTAVVNIVKPGVGDQVLPTVGTQEWKTVGIGLKGVNVAHDGIKSMLWLASIGEHSTMYSSSESLGNVLGAIGKVRSAVENFDSASRAGYGNVEGAALSAIAEGLGYIPVLGAYYKEAFQLIPGITAGMINIAQRRDARFAKLGIDMRTRLEY